MQSNYFARASAIAYVAWGLLHLVAAVAIYDLATTMQSGEAQGRVQQDAWNIAIASIFAVVIGLTLVWHNKSWGHWLNGIVIGAVDLGYLIFVVGPGYVALFPDGLLGPIIWLLAVLLGIVAAMQQRSSTP